MTEYKSYLQDSLDELNKYIKEVGSRPIFFVGSGISQRYMNTPTWEKLLPKYEPIIGQEIIYRKKSTNIGHILKIHGSIEEIESIVIEENDYINFYERQIYLVAKLFTYFMEHPIIFLGYSLNDKNIQSILSNVKKIIDVKKEGFIENIWIIDWSSNPIESDTIPPKRKSLSVGNGESVRINYIQLHNFNKLYKSLYQETIDINYLQQIEETIYNVIKSDSITNLEVDIASLHNITIVKHY